MSRTSDAERAARDRAEKADAAWQQVGLAVGRRYNGVSLENFEIATKAQEDAVSALRGFADSIGERVDQGQGLVLLGPKGTGKDHLAIACLRHAKNAGFVTKADDGQALFQKFRDVIGSDASEKDSIKTYTLPDVLLLSDPIPMTGTTSDYQKSILWRIIDRRYRDLKPTWVTLNVADRQEADGKLGAQIVDRLCDGATVVMCKWASHRRVSGGDS